MIVRTLGIAYFEELKIKLIGINEKVVKNTRARMNIFTHSLYILY